MKKALACVAILVLAGLFLLLPMLNAGKDIKDMFDMFESEITPNMTLAELLEAFENMCRVPLDNIPQAEDLILFEVGTFSFTDEPMVYFSLTRQVPGEDGEYLQLHLDIQYTPNDINRSLEECVWDDDVTGDIFDYVRTSQAYQILIHEPIKNIEVYLDET